MKTAPKTSKLSKTSSTPPVTERKTILVAVSGESPAVITETLWALAQETPPVKVSAVHVLTTTRGEARLKKLFDDKIWKALEKDLKQEMPLTVVGLTNKAGEPLEDIRTGSENDATADLILETLIKLQKEGNPRIIASLAGGRKTMGSLLSAAMTLVGQPDDRLVHVLVNSPYDDPRVNFYFPQKKTKYFQGEAEIPHAPEITLSEVPFIPLNAYLRTTRSDNWSNGFKAATEHAKQFFDSRLNPLYRPVLRIEIDQRADNINFYLDSHLLQFDEKFIPINQKILVYLWLLSGEVWVQANKPSGKQLGAIITVALGQKDLSYLDEEGTINYVKALVLAAKKWPHIGLVKAAGGPVTANAIYKAKNCLKPALENLSLFAESATWHTSFCRVGGGLAMPSVKSIQIDHI